MSMPCKESASEAAVCDCVALCCYELTGRPEKEAFSRADQRRKRRADHRINFSFRTSVASN